MFKYSIRYPSFWHRYSSLHVFNAQTYLWNCKTDSLEIKLKTFWYEHIITSSAKARTISQLRGFFLCSKISWIPKRIPKTTEFLRSFRNLRASAIFGVILSITFVVLSSIRASGTRNHESFPRMLECRIDQKYFLSPAKIRAQTLTEQTYNK